MTRRGGGDVVPYIAASRAVDPPGTPHEHRGGRRAFYVTVRNGPRTGYLLGPYELYQSALDNVERARELAKAADPRDGPRRAEHAARGDGRYRRVGPRDG